MGEDGEGRQGDGRVGDIQELVEAAQDLLIEEVGAIHEGQHLVARILGYRTQNTGINE